MMLMNAIPATTNIAAITPPYTHKKTAGFANERNVSHCRHRGQTFAVR
jgi:hypothetical protein